MRDQTVFQLQTSEPQEKKELVDVRGLSTYSNHTQRLMTSRIWRVSNLLRIVETCIAPAVFTPNPRSSPPLPY